MAARFNYSSYHSGGGSREILDTGDINISSTATDLEIRLYNDDTNAVYFGDSWIEGTGVTIRELPIAIDYASDIAVVEGLESGRPTDTTVGKYRHSGRGQTIYDYALAFHTDHETTTQIRSYAVCWAQEAL
jgi:hypothetical protein